MNEFQKEIFLLIDKLEKSVASEESSENITLNYLKGLAASEKAVDKRALAMGIADLEQFWVTSINWCSELSKDVEKIIILYQEQL